MNDIPRQKLNYIVAQYQSSVCENAKLCEGLLRDLCGEYRKEINAIVNAIKEGVGSDLLHSQYSTPSNILLSQITKKLEDRMSMSPDVALWAVDSIALALGVISQPRSVQPLVANPQPNLVPPSSNGQQSSIQPAPTIASASLPNSPPKFFNIWMAIATITVLGFGVAYHHKSQDFNTQVAEVKLRDIQIRVLENTNQFLEKRIKMMEKNQRSVDTSINFCNASSAEVISVALAYQETSSIMGRLSGWFNIRQGECQNVSVAPNYQGDTYIHGIGDRGNLKWGVKDFYFCATKEDFSSFGEFSRLSASCQDEKTFLVNANKFTVRPGVNQYNFMN